MSLFDIYSECKASAMQAIILARESNLHVYARQGFRYRMSAWPEPQASLQPEWQPANTLSESVETLKNFKGHS